MNENNRNCRSIEFGKAICQKLQDHPDLIQIPNCNIQKWEQREGETDPALEEWKTLLNGSREKIYEILIGTDSESQRIRSSSPFAGVLTQKERLQIIKKYK